MDCPHHHVDSTRLAHLPSSHSPIHQIDKQPQSAPVQAVQRIRPIRLHNSSNAISCSPDRHNHHLHLIDERPRDIGRYRGCFILRISISIRRGRARDSPHHSQSQWRPRRVGGDEALQRASSHLNIHGCLLYAFMSYILDN